MNALSTVASFFKDGGPFMFIILGVAVVILAIVLERLVVVGSAAAINGRKMMNDILRCLAKGDVAGARNVSNASGAPVARVAQAILQARANDEARLMNAADAAAAAVLPPLTRRLTMLNVLANVATLLGLLGTIFGLILAFSAVGAADPAQRATFLAAGISQALNTTALGLIVAVPALLLHAWFVGLVEGVADQVDEMSLRVSQEMARASGQAGPASVVPLHAAGGAGAPRGQHGTLHWDDGVR
jgi:biopolymer transport protein ExbB/TolQ